LQKDFPQYAWYFESKGATEILKLPKLAVEEKPKETGRGLPAYLLVGLSTIVRVITVTNVLYCYWYILYLHVVRGVFVVCRVTTRQTLSGSGRRPHRIAVATRVPQMYVNPQYPNINVRQVYAYGSLAERARMRKEFQDYEWCFDREDKGDDEDEEDGSVIHCYG
jgi:hypothetical protein